jgi:hypothetical protein
MKFLAILFLSLFATIVYSEDFPVMLSIKSEIKVPNDFRDGVEEALTTMGYSLVDEKAQKEALAENAKARNSECYDDACLVDTGKMLAARALISVEVEKKGDKAYKFKGKFIDFETGTTTKTKVMYYEYELSNFKELSKFGKNFSAQLLTGKEVRAQNIEPIQKEVRAQNIEPIQKEVRAQNIEPTQKEVRAQNIEPIQKEEKEVEKPKEVKKEIDTKILLLLPKRYKGKWDVTLGLIGGAHDTYTEYYNENDEYDRDFYGTLTGLGFSLGLTYRWNHWLSFFSEFTFLNSFGEVSRETKYNEYEDVIDSMTITTINFSLGAQFSFGDTQGTGLVYYAKLALYSGRDSYSNDSLDNYNNENIYFDIGNGDFISTVGGMIELGVNINLFFNNNIDIYAAFYYGPQTGGGLEGLSITDPSTGNLINDYYLFNSGESANIVLGVRYNVYTF